MIYCSTCKHFAICYKAKQAIDLEKPLQFKKCVHYNAADKENPVLTFAEKLKEYCNEIANQEWNKKTSPVSWADAYEDFIDDIDRLLEEMGCNDG